MLPSPAPDICVLLLVRHGATAANLSKPHVLQGCGLDLSLCELGVKQAEAAAQFLASVPCSAVFSSRLKRAVETAERIAKVNGDHAVETIAGLHEVDVGHWEGRDWDEIQRNDVEAHRQFMEDPAKYGYPGGETIVDVVNRVAPIFETLAKQNIGKRIIVVAHNVVLRAYLASLLGIPLSQYRRITQDNCCVNVLVWQDGVMSARTVNSTFHLG